MGGDRFDGKSSEGTQGEPSRIPFGEGQKQRIEDGKRFLRSQNGRLDGYQREAPEQVAGRGSGEGVLEESRPGVRGCVHGADGMDHGSIQGGVPGDGREAARERDRGIKEGDVCPQGEAGQDSQDTPGCSKKEIDERLVFHSCRAAGNKMGVVPMSRKRLRVWIETFFPDGNRMGLEAIELDRSEVLRLLKAIADHLEP